MSWLEWNLSEDFFHQYFCHVSWFLWSGGTKEHQKYWKIKEIILAEVELNSFFWLILVPGTITSLVVGTYIYYLFIHTHIRIWLMTYADIFICEHHYLKKEPERTRTWLDKMFRVCSETGASLEPGPWPQEFLVAY